jgi:transposase
MFITAGTENDCTYGEKLIEGIDAEWLLADKGYDTDAIIAAAVTAGMQIVIPPKSNRKDQRDYDTHLYKQRHLVENAFQALKRWRGIATRYAKRVESFLAAVHIRCIAIWGATY